MINKTLAFSLLLLVLSAFSNSLPANIPLTTKVSKELTDTEDKSIALSLEESILKMDDLFLEIYNSIKGNTEKPSLIVFKKAMIGYYNLMDQGKLEKKNILTIVDFTLSSDKKRLWIIDLSKKEILLNDFVAHGKNTGNIVAESFSNLNESYMSSLGFYVTGETYYGKHGLSLRLNGMEAGFNENAFSRAIVVHGADYVSQEFINNYGRLGRSYGCPAVSKDVCETVINTIKDKSCLFVYASALDYDTKSALLNTQSAVNYLTATNFTL